MKLRDYMMGLGTGVVLGIVASQAATKINPNKPADLVLDRKSVV